MKFYLCFTNFSAYFPLLWCTKTFLYMFHKAFPHLFEASLQNLWRFHSKISWISLQNLDTSLQNFQETSLQNFTDTSLQNSQDISLRNFQDISLQNFWKLWLEARLAVKPLGTRRGSAFWSLLIHGKQKFCERGHTKSWVFGVIYKGFCENETFRKCLSMKHSIYQKAWKVLTLRAPKLLVFWVRFFT